MIHGYIRVSTDRQTVENQRFEINQFCLKNAFQIDCWIEEAISGTKDVDERKLGKLLRKMTKGDVLVCSELSRLGRSLLMIMSILNLCMKKDVQVWTIKENYKLGNDISSKVLAFAFGLSAEIERNLISQRTKEALARRRMEGGVLGRPKGVRCQAKKLHGREKEILDMKGRRVSISGMSRALGVHRTTLAMFIKEGMKPAEPEPVAEETDMECAPQFSWWCLDFQEAW